MAADDSIIIFYLIIFLVLWIYIAYSVQKIANKTNTNNAWMAWIPILNLVLMLRISRQPLWVMIGFFIPYVNYLIMAAVWGEIAGVLNKSKWWGLLWLVPVLNLILPGYLAFSESPVPASN